jgi:N-acetylmuramoyl-L-alanine amidase
MTWLSNKLTASDTAIEIHFDASGSGGPNGCTAFVPLNPTAKEIELGRGLCNAIFEAAQINPRGSNRGVRDEGFTHHKRLRFLHSPAVATNVLLEVCFITSDSDWNKYISNRDNIATMLSNSIYNHLKRQVNG